MNILRNKQVILELPQHKLIQDVTTRWNSTYDMVSRFLEQYPAIEATLQMKEVKKNAKEVNTLSDDDLANAESVMSVLEPLKTATTLLCGEVSPTVSLIHPLKHKLIQQLKVKDSDNSLAKAVKEAISKDLEPRYTESSIEQFLLQSSYLDPRFKSMPYLDKTEAQQILHTLTEKAATLTDLMHIKVEEEVNNNQDSLPSLPALLPDDGISMDTNAKESQGASEARDSSVKEPPLKKTRSAMSELFGKVFVTKVEEAKPFEVRFEQKILDYESEKTVPLESDPLQWWGISEGKYPLLSKLAKLYLCVPATSVASERIFSTAGDLVTAQRSCLKSDQVDRLIFLKKNLK